MHNIIEKKIFRGLANKFDHQIQNEHVKKNLHKNQDIFFFYAEHVVNISLNYLVADLVPETRVLEDLAVEKWV